MPRDFVHTNRSSILKHRPPCRISITHRHQQQSSDGSKRGGKGTASACAGIAVNRNERSASGFTLADTSRVPTVVTPRSNLRDLKAHRKASFVDVTPHKAGLIRKCGYALTPVYCSTDQDE